MKKFFTILAVTMLVVSCYQEYEVPLPQKDREVLSAPTRLDRYVNGFSFNDSLMVLGPQLENPYALENMQQARAQLMEEDPSLNIPEITISHIYARFAPANDDELYTLLQDTTVHFFDFPLDREVISGVYYHDPAIADSLPTYQYVSIPIERWAMNYANSDISHEILEYLCIPEDDENFWGGGDDGNITPNPGIGTITPIIPGPWIPAPDPGEDGPIGPNNITLSQEDITDMLVDRAMYLTGNLDSDSDTSTQSVAGTNSSSSRWTPSGRITAYDDIANAQIPLEGVKVWAHRWFTIREGYTDANGYFTCDGTLKGKANYYIKWERAYWDIREGDTGQAYYNEPSKISGEWNLSITSTTPKSLAYSAIHRALYRIYYGNIDGLYRPNYNKKTKVLYHHSNNGRINGLFTISGSTPKIKIWGIKTTGIAQSPSFIYSCTCHELVGHGVHKQHCSWHSNLSLQYIESWARCIQYYLTYLEYQELNVLSSLNVISPERSVIDVDFEYNFQQWNKAEHSDYEYTPIFVDIIDNYNQKQIDEENQTSNYPNDMVYYSNIVTLQNVVFASNDFLDVLSNLVAILYNPNSSSYNDNAEIIRNLIILFDSYGYEANFDFDF